MTVQDDRPVLGFDTSGPYCTAALVNAHGVIATAHEDRARGQVERLMPFLQELLAQAGTGWAALGAIGVGIGPGNFTGIRISVSAARGLALSLGVPAIGVSGLSALAHGVTRPCIATLPAPRGAQYVQVFDARADHPPQLMTPDALALAGFPRGVVCVGDDAQNLAELMGGTAFSPAPLAVNIALVARDLRHQPHPRPTPLYLRPADAAPAKDRAPDLLP